MARSPAELLLERETRVSYGPVPDRLFDVLQPSPELRDKLARDRATALLCRAALQLMTSGDRDPTELPLGTLSIHWTQFLLISGLGFKLSELRRQAGLLMMRAQ